MIGPESRATEITDILFRDIDVIHALSVEVIAIFSGDRAPISRVRYENIRIEDPRCMGLIGIRVGPTYVTADPEFGPVRDVLYQNIDVTMPSPVHSALCGDRAAISGVTFRNVRINGRAMAGADEMRLHTRGEVADVRFASDRGRNLP